MRMMSLRVRPLQLSSSNRLPPLTCRRTKCFPPSSTTCAVLLLLLLSHSGLISFDGKMNVIISLPQKKSPCSVAHFQQRIAILPSFSICRRRSTSSGIAALRAIQPGGTASRSSIYSSARGPPTASSRPKGARGRAPLDRRLPAPARRARRPSVESPSDVTGYSLTLWLSR